MGEKEKEKASKLRWRRGWPPGSQPLSRAALAEGARSGCCDVQWGGLCHHWAQPRRPPGRGMPPPAPTSPGGPSELQRRAMAGHRHLMLLGLVLRPLEASCPAGAGAVAVAVLGPSGGHGQPPVPAPHSSSGLCRVGTHRSMSGTAYGAGSGSGLPAGSSSGASSGASSGSESSQLPSLLLPLLGLQRALRGARRRACRCRCCGGRAPVRGNQGQAWSRGARREPGAGAGPAGLDRPPRPLPHEEARSLSVLGHLEAETPRPDQMSLLPAPQLPSPHPAWGDTAHPLGVGTPSGRLSKASP